MNSPTVYSAQAPGRHNITDALRFGTIEYLLPEGNLTLPPETIQKIMLEKLARFTRYDYLLLLGDPIAIALAFKVASDLSPVVQLLKYNRDAEKYFVVTFKEN